MPKTWLEWHDLYNTEARLQQRLEIVREYISSSLDASPPGIIRVISVCAGDGRVFKIWKKPGFYYLE